MTKYNIHKDSKQVINIINLIEKNFLNIAQKYNLNVQNASAYYLTRNQNSFMQILLEIFNYEIEIYGSDQHLIAKIGDHFYDIRGCVDCINLEQFNLCSIDEIIKVRSNIIDEQIKQEMILIGNEYIENLYNNKKLVKKNS